MTPNRWIPLLLVLLSLAIVGAGCGSNDKNGGTGGSSSLSKAEFVRRGNAICAAGNKETEAQGQKLFGGQRKKPSKSQLTQFAATVLIPSVQKQVDQIRALGAPKGDEAKVKAIVDAAQQGIDKGKQNPLALTGQSGGDPFKKANALARAYGLTVCGS
jgi:hypothetical protein